MYMIEVWPLATSLCNKSGCINYTGNGGLNYGFFGCILVVSTLEGVFLQMFTVPAVWTDECCLSLKHPSFVS